MATRGDYAPVDSEDITNNRLLEDIHRTSTDGTSMGRLNSHESKKQKCISMWTFSLIILGLSVMFLVGICVGFYVRDLQTDNLRVEDICGNKKKNQATDYDRLGSLHETLVYYIRGENIKEFVNEHGHDDSVTGSDAETRLARAVLDKFDSYRVDLVDVEEHEIMVTHADPDHPNELKVLDSSGRILELMVLTNKFPSAGNTSLVSEEISHRWKHPHVVYSPAGEVQSDLVYGHYGRETDFIMLQALGVEVKGRVIMLRLGKLSLADKVRNCESHGVRGVILYREPEPQDVIPLADSSYIPYASAAAYSTEQRTLWTPSILCQTISSDQAKVLMTLLRLTNSSISAPISWQGSLATTYVTGGQKSGSSIVVHLSVWNLMYKQKIENIISTIQGTEEPDRYVIVGTPRSSLPGQPQDVVASTSILIQLAHSFHYLYNQHHWKPKRGVKFISWGGAEMSNSGILHYIKANHHLLDRRALAYFDISQLVLGNGSIVANIPPGLHQLIQETTFDVPDPNNVEQSLQISWKLFAEKNKNMSDQAMIPLESYNSDRTLNPFLHVLGVPEVKLQYRASPRNLNSVAAMVLEEHRHHYKYHITVTHILVKSLLAVLDNELLPFNLQNEVRVLQVTLWQTLDMFARCFPNEESLYSAVGMCEDLLKAADDLREASNLFTKRSNIPGIRMINDILMTFERQFLVHKNGRSQHILYPAHDDGSLAEVADLCDVQNATLMGNLTREFEDNLRIVMRKALSLFRFSA
uniref:Uncharacterized protein n=1 Tax=Arion vulgaris TaxID=1028688 RepID=A0A0B7AZN7_9EUPU